MVEIHQSIEAYLQGLDGSPENYVKAALDGGLDPRIRAACADRADALGHVVADLHSFVLVPNAEKPAFMIGRYPVTNVQYARFLQKENFANPQLWCNFPKFSDLDKKIRQAQRLGDWGNEGWDWLQQQEKKDGIHFPPYWFNSSFGIARPNAPVVTITWYEANAYCRWLLARWDELSEGKQELPKPIEIRLPAELEWMQAAGGKKGARFAWGELNSPQEITRFANVYESRIGRTTPVWMYPQGESIPYKLMDISGNVFEWQANNYGQGEGRRLRGGSWSYLMEDARVANRSLNIPLFRDGSLGFRVLGVL